MVERFKTCCGCLPLRTGTIILGIIWIVGCISSMAMLISTDFGEISYSGVSLLLTILEILLTILLIVGAVKRSWKFIRPWLIANVLIIVIQLLYIIIGSAETIPTEDPAVRKLAITYLILGIFGIGISVVLWFIPYSYHQELREQQQKRIDVHPQPIRLSHI